MRCSSRFISVDRAHLTNSMYIGSYSMIFLPLKPASVIDDFISEYVDTWNNDNAFSSRCWSSSLLFVIVLIGSSCRLSLCLFIAGLTIVSTLNIVVVCVAVEKRFFNGFKCSLSVC